MATIKEIRIQAQLLSSIQIDPATAYHWATDEMLNIAAEYPRAGVYTKETVTTTTAFETYMPARKLIKLDKVIELSTGRLTTDFELHREELTISVPGQYEIRYYSYPDIPQTDTEQIDIPRQYVVPLKFYLAARIRARLFGQNDANAVSFIQEYNEKMKKADITTDTVVSRHRRMPPGRRDV